MKDGVEFILEFILSMIVVMLIAVFFCFSLCFMVPAACSLFPQRWLVELHILDIIISFQLISLGGQN